MVKTLRLAGRYRIIGVDMVASSFGFSEVDEGYTVPPASDPQYLDVLLDICSARRVKVLIHGSEPELKVLSEHREQVAGAGILLPINSRAVIEMGLDKWATFRALRDHGFRVPETMVVHSPRELRTDFPLPAVVKPAVGGGGSNNTFLVQERDELEFACLYLTRQGKSALLQEYVGAPHDEYTVGVLSTLEGCFVDSIALRRNILTGLSNRLKSANRTRRAELSPVLAISSGVSQGVIADFPEVRRKCEAIARAVNSVGPINIQCRFTQGELYPFEINPRFSGTAYIRALMGFNEPDMLIGHHLLGEQIPTPVPYRFGEVVRGICEQVVTEALMKGPWSTRTWP
jgi:carbamoyl-phosphate synthase large subunit